MTAQPPQQEAPSGPLSLKPLDGDALYRLQAIVDELAAAMEALHFKPPVAYVYDPLIYAQAAYTEYLRRYAQSPKEAVLVGMNPGPWGMAQTGIPFGEVPAVRDWLGIEAPIGAPVRQHPKRLVEGFSCPRNEVSGQRLWGWARDTFETPERFFSRFFVANYCPLLFLEASGRNRTPNTLRAEEQKPLFEACDRALRRTVEWFRPKYVIGVGQFAAERAREALSGLDVTVGRITHPSPANPKANRGWAKIVSTELAALGIHP